MSRAHQESLRIQLIEALERELPIGLPKPLATRLFQDALWPVLDRAMEAGELLVSRATIPQKPVHEALRIWLEGCCATVARLKAEEATVSRAEALKALYQLAVGAEHALEDAKLLSP